jgi:hypothetical protein
MRKLYSYVIPVDDGAAPNPYGGVCTLTICKPAIRRSAEPGNWVLGTGSKNVILRDGIKRDFSGHLVYAMLITAKLSLEDYDAYCKRKLKIKIPKWTSTTYSRVVGDCLYDFNGPVIIQRDGIHDTEVQFERNLNGKNALLSTHFYYFGSTPVKIPRHLQHIVHTTQNCKLVLDEKTISAFEKWINSFKRNHLYAEPQQQHAFENVKC